MKKLLQFKTAWILCLLFSISSISKAQTGDPILGEIRMFAGNFAPKGWAFCDGSLMSINQNTALFTILGTFYGGNGTSNFALPDLRGRFPMGTGNGNANSAGTVSPGQTGGSSTATLTTANIPPHTHSFNVYNGNATDSTKPTGNTLALPLSADLIPTRSQYTTNTPNTTISTQSIGTTGGGLPINTLSPYTGVNFIIALQGIFPTRN